MKIHKCVSLIALAFFAAFLPAVAESTPSQVKYRLNPSESQTIYASGLKESTEFPVFKICLGASSAYGASLHLLETGKGMAIAPVEPLSEGKCIFVSSEKIVVSINAAMTPETDATRQEAADKAHVWLEERVAALRSTENRTDVQTSLLEEFEARLAKGPAEAISNDKTALRLLETRQIISALEAKDKLSPKETLELTALRNKLTRITDDSVLIIVTMMPS